MRASLRSAVGVATALLLLSPTLATSAGARALRPAAPGPDTTAGSLMLHREPTTPLLARRGHGRAVLRALGEHLPAAAAINHTTAARLTRLITTDPTATLGRDGRLFYTEKSAAAAAPTSASAPVSAAAAPYPLDQTFTLHSRPTSTHTIFLDFGATTLSSSSWWVTNGGMTAGTFAGFSMDADPAFSDAEKTFIQEVWRIVAEKYSPFDVDVTTADPGVAGYSRSSSSDTTYGTHVVFSDDANAVNQACGGNCAGVALVGVFDTVDSGTLDPAWVFTSKTYDSPALTAHDAAHEIGHTFGLQHDATSTSGYYQGQGNWFPIMGSGIRAVGQFSKGEYADATTTQSNPDDLAVIAAGGAPLLPDDYGSTPQTAWDLGTQSSYAVDGVISTATDQDVFAINRPCVGDLTATATGIGEGTSLDIKLTVLDGSGNVVSSNDPPSGQDTSAWPYLPTGMDAGLTVSSAPAGTYYLSIDGVGNGDPLTTGYSDYASIGQYHLSVTGCAGVVGQPPTVPTAVSATPNPRTSTGTVTWAAPTSAGDSPITGYRVTGPAGTVTVDAATFSAPVTGLTPGVTYPISVAALNASGPSPNGTTSIRVPTWAPGTAPGLSVAVSGTTATLSWSAPIDPGQAALAGWHLELLRSGVVVSDNQLPVNASSGSFFGVPTGGYQARITGEYTADDLTGIVPATRYFTIAVAPSSPHIGRAASGTAGGISTAVARWSAPSSTGGAAITGYRVRAYLISSSGRVLRAITSTTLRASARSYTMRLARGHYRFRVRAMNRVGYSAYSAYSAMVTAR